MRPPIRGKAAPTRPVDATTTGFQQPGSSPPSLELSLLVSSSSCISQILSGVFLKFLKAYFSGDATTVGSQPGSSALSRKLSKLFPPFPDKPYFSNSEYLILKKHISQIFSSDDSSTDEAYARHQLAGIHCSLFLAAPSCFSR